MTADPRGPAGYEREVGFDVGALFGTEEGAGVADIGFNQWDEIATGTPYNFVDRP